MDNNKTVKQEENVAILGDKQIKESEMSLEQKYFTKQIADLRNKKAQITFELDQVDAALNVFQNSFIQSTKETSKEVLKSETKTLNTEGGK